MTSARPYRIRDLAGKIILAGSPAIPLTPWQNLVNGWTRFVIRVFPNPYVVNYAQPILIGLLALAGIIVVLLVVRIIRGGGGQRQAVIPSKFDSPRQVAKAAKRAAKSGSLVRAGELYEQAEIYPKSVAMYLKGGAFTRAANVLSKKMGAPEKALEILLERNLHDPAAVLLESLDRNEEAAQHYLLAGKTQTAAALFEKAGELKAAADLYRKLNGYGDAARCYGKIPEWPAAAEMYEQYFKHFLQNLSGRENTKDAGKYQELAKRTAYCWKQAGNLNRAAEILYEAGLRKLAAELWAAGGEHLKAAEIYLEEKELRKAAELFNKGGERKRAAGIVAQLHQSEGRPLEAAKFLELAEEYLAAADLQAGQRNYEKAAQLYLKGGDSRTASEMYVAAGKVDKAVKMFEELGDIDSAIRTCEESGNRDALAALYERRGRPYDAALMYLEHGLSDQAVPLLEKIPPDHPRYGEASAKLGSIYMGQGKLDVALDKLQAMAGRMPLSPLTVDNYYLLAQAYDRSEHVMYAIPIYQQLYAMNYRPQDIAMRLNALAQKMAATQATAWAKAHSTIAGRYKMVKELGRGGMGVVYLAEDTRLGRQVAFKVLSEELKADPEMVKIFVREYQSLAKLNHQYIVSLIDAGQEGGAYYIIMEYIAGKNFKELLTGNRRLPLSGGVQVFMQLAQALDFAHGLKVIHRDIKPANIMWTPTQIIKIMDFGLATIMDQMREHRTMIAGTPNYMSPEQTLGRGVDHRSDIYSMGVTIYELLTGRVPFTEGDIGYHHLHTPPPPPRQFNPQITPELEAMILKCMAKDQRQRYQSAGEVYEELMRTFGPGRT